MADINMQRANFPLNDDLVNFHLFLFVTSVHESLSAVNLRIPGYPLSLFKQLQWFDERIARIPKYSSKH